MASPNSGDVGAAGDLLRTGLLAASKDEETPAVETTATSTSSGRLAEHEMTPTRSPVRQGVRRAAAELQEVFLGTKLFPLFSAVPLAVAAEHFRFARAWVFVFSLIGLAPLAERVSFLSEHIADTAGPTAGGLLNATCGNVPELIIALFALHKEKMEILKWSLLGSILSNLLLVLGSSLLCGGLANTGKERPLDRRQADVSIGLLMLGVLCHILPLLSKYTASTGDSTGSVLGLSRLCAIVMLIAYFGGLVFQLKTHRQFFVQEESSQSSSSNSDDEVTNNSQPVRLLVSASQQTNTSRAYQPRNQPANRPSVIGSASTVIWLIGMTVVIAVLSNYVITTIEEASDALGIPVRFISIILLPVVGNAAEHTGAIIFAFKNKIDITLGIALGSATQILLLVVPVILIVSWVNGIPMDLDLNLVETGSLVMTVFTTAFTLQDGKWHYLKGFNLTLCYIVIAVCFFTIKAVPTPKKVQA
ncbi:vacuolar cation/proton exchanger 1c-like isoform X2 [Miscanthus floridulus]|uniref:vacuolar cation/proton exchanger 1c-like isoform X2 n=1 Tax=Miscanthus floridulus TaxID=154761 RepID=UPI00345A95A6